MKKLVALCFILIFLSGCSSLNKQIEKVDNVGIVKVYNYPYKEVFSACESAFSYVGLRIDKSNFEEGYIKAYFLADVIFKFNTLVLIKKDSEDKTIVKYRDFWRVSQKKNKAFFKKVEKLLER